MERPESPGTLNDVKNYLDAALTYVYGEKEKSDDFCGLYFHGRVTPFTLAEHDIPIRTFRYYSRYSYPIYLFYNEASGGEIEEVLGRYDNIIVVPIEPMLSIDDYDRFVIFEMFRKIKINKTLTFHSDGFLINPGWEDFINRHDFDYIGAPWCRHTGHDGELFKPGCREKYNVIRETGIGNGGFCFRKRDKALEVVKAVDPDDLNWKYMGHLPDDVFFSYFGFGLGIYRYYENRLAYKWSMEPFRGWHTFGFHRV